VDGFFTQEISDFNKKPKAAVELSGMCKALSSIPSTTKINNK
jgi:hypothetical protein